MGVEFLRLPVHSFYTMVRNFPNAKWNAYAR